MIVLDGSAAVEYLTVRKHGPWVEATIAEDPDVHAPHLLDVEVANALRRLVWRGELAAADAETAIRDLAALDVARYPHSPLLERMWRLRGNLSAYDAAYVSLAGLLGATFVTTDRRLTRTPLDVEILCP